jgi:hypothetical protein
MIESDSFITYSLDKSVTTQKLKGKNVGDIFNNLSAFLINCTTANPTLPSDITLTSYSPYDSNDDPEIANKIATDLTSLFGEGGTTPISYHYPGGEPSTQTKTERNIDKLYLGKALKFMAEGQPWPKYTFGPVDLMISFSFKLVNPITKNILSKQVFDSHIIIWISRTFSCSPTLFFPFESSNEAFNLYLRKIDSFLPFELKHKYLRRVRGNKNKTGFIYKKL